MTTPITLTGNLTADPELRFTPSGAAVCNFTVVVNERIKNAQTGEWEDGEASFYNCSVWRDQAENVAESLQKGMRVIVSGGVKIRSYEKRDGSGKGLSVDVNVDEVGPSLRWSTAKVTRAARQNNGGGQPQGGGWDNAPQQGAPQGAPQGGGWGNQPQGGGQPAGDPWATPAGVNGGNDEPPF